PRRGFVDKTLRGRVSHATLSTRCSQLSDCSALALGWPQICPYRRRTQVLQASRIGCAPRDGLKGRSKSLGRVPVGAFIRYRNVDASRGERLVAEFPLNGLQRHALFREDEAERVLQAVGMPFFLRKSGAFRQRLKQPEERRTVHTSTLLRQEEIV